MNNIAIRAEKLSKIYTIGGKNERYKALRDTLSDAAIAPLRGLRSAFKRSASDTKARHAKETIWALNEVSFELKQGDVMGVIGRNGAGKSTLLKVLSRITEPTKGYADVNGRVGSLLEVGTGFHPELTGAENIFLSGAILGMRKAEIKRKFDEIVAFAEVEKFIDTPVKHFSSGMYLRLAFAVAAHLEPEILMVDEVLAVGDLAFQRKCIGKMQEVGETGQTVVFVSHDMTAISRLATLSLVLQDGKIVFNGPTSEAIDVYSSQRQTKKADLATRTDRKGDGVVRLHSLAVKDANGEIVDTVGSGDAISIHLGYTSRVRNLRYEELALDMRFADAMGHPITTLSTRFSPHSGSDFLSDEGVLTCHIPNLTLAEDTYSIDLWLACRGGLADQVAQAGELRVVASNFYGTGQEPVKRKHGAALIKHNWTADEVDSRASAVSDEMVDAVSV